MKNINKYISANISDHLSPRFQTSTNSLFSLKTLFEIRELYDKEIEYMLIRVPIQNQLDSQIKNNI